MGNWPLALLIAISAAAATAGAAEPYELTSGYLSLAGEAATVTSLRLDPTGAGRYGPNLLRSAGFAGIEPTPETAWRRDGDTLTVTGLALRRKGAIDIPHGGEPVRLEPGHTLGQSFTVPLGEFGAVSVLLPTWHTTTSGALLRLRRGGAQGAVVAERRLENVPDNSQQTLTFAAQPAGVYVIELTEPVGEIGWWGNPADVYAGGTATVDGVAETSRDRVTAARYARLAERAEMSLALAGPDLRWELRLLSAAEGAPPALVMTLPWRNDGYDSSARAVPFSRFYTSNQRYLCAEQFKRTAGPGLGFGPCDWIEADGAAGADVRLSATDLRAGWTMTADTMTMRLDTGPTAPGVSAFTLTAQPRDDALPASWPHFGTPDPALTEDLNRWFYERAFSYPAPAGMAAWYEWSALIRFWFAGPACEGEARGLRDAVVDSDGYVYTWGGGRGWPFPDNAVYDTRHFDTNARYILACWRYLCWTGDSGFLRSEAPRLRRAMEYQLGYLGGEDGLIIARSKDTDGRHGSCGNNYWDIIPFGHLDAYANAVYYASLEAMAQIEELLADEGVEVAPAGRSPQSYRRLGLKVRRAYSTTFWDPEAGRFIGCVDIDGKRHDYGFTFVNLEAMSYGLASSEQVRRIYDWLEHGVSSTGKADIYSAYQFAPRATTIHNPMWDEKGVNDPQAAGVEPWWHFGWHGTPFGDVQCQDGGAILYTSFFDLMARSRYLGPDNAWGRWSAIIDRYRLPDRLCGGPPLSRGETPQQAIPGAVGLDLPFPESGLVPCWFVHGVAGAEATSEGLRITPRLPAGLPWLTVYNLSYRGQTLDLTVRPREVVLESREPGREWRWRRRIPVGGTAIFRGEATGG